MSVQRCVQRRRARLRSPYYEEVWEGHGRGLYPSRGLLEMNLISIVGNAVNPHARRDPELLGSCAGHHLNGAGGRDEHLGAQKFVVK
jgi:hypothetical protein